MVNAYKIMSRLKIFTIGLDHVKRIYSKCCLKIISCFNCTLPYFRSFTKYPINMKKQVTERI